MQRDRLNIYKETYNNEIARKEKLGSELTIPIAVITLQVSIITYAVGKMDITKKSIALILLVIAITSLVTAIVFSISYLIKSYYNYPYEFIATPKQMEEYYNKLTETYKEYSDCEFLTEKYFELYLINHYCKCNETNIRNNDNRAGYLHKAKTAIIAGLISSAIIVGLCNYNKVFGIVQECLKLIP